MFTFTFLSEFLILFNILEHLSIGYVIDCANPTEKCQNTTVICAENTDCSISCTQQQQCMESIVICPKVGDCLISCDADSSCQFSQIIGPTKGHLTVRCLGKQSCFNTLFDGSQSLTLNIAGCTQHQSCFYLTVYCPMHSTETKNCFIQGNNNFGGNEGEGTKIYAVNSWQDIDINYNGSIDALHRGTMFCGDNYNNSCNITQSDWLCNDLEDECSVIDDITNSLPNDTIDFIYDKPKDKVNGYIFVGAWVLALAFAYIICGSIKYALKSAIQYKNRQKSMSYDTESDDGIIPDGRVPTVVVDD